MAQVSALEPYIGLVEYLGATLGAQYEILLQDMENHVLLSIANGYISVRVKGGAVTPLALELEERGVWKQTDYLTNVRCETTGGHHILSSFYFIKREERLVGILSINLDTTLFSRSNSPELSLLSTAPAPGPGGGAAAPAAGGEAAAAPGSMEQTVDETVEEYLRRHGTPAERLSYQERQTLISALKERDVFRIRGSVRYVAQKLGCSSATIYRYLQN